MATMRRLAPLALTVVLAACGGSGGTTATTPPTRVDTTTSTTSTTLPVTTTTLAPLSRDARLAVERCRSSLGMFFAEQVSLDETYLDDARSACEEAEVQLDADVPTAGSVASALMTAVLRLDLALAYVGVRLALDSFDVEQQTTLQEAVDAFEAEVEPLLVR